MAPDLTVRSVLFQRQTDQTGWMLSCRQPLVDFVS
jgi:hypothetical protein